MKKKIICLLLLITLLFSLVACGGESSAPEIVTEFGTFNWEMSKEQVKNSLGDEYTLAKYGEKENSLYYIYSNPDDPMAALEDSFPGLEMDIIFVFFDGKLGTIYKSASYIPEDQNELIPPEKWTAAYLEISKNYTGRYGPPAMEDYYDNLLIATYWVDDTDVEISISIKNDTSSQASITCIYEYNAAAYSYTTAVQEAGKQVVEIVDDYLDHKISAEEAYAKINPIHQRIQDYDADYDHRIIYSVSFLDITFKYFSIIEDETVLLQRNDLARKLLLEIRQ